MERNRHTPELIDEKEDIYRCTKCGKRGKFKGDFYDDCPSNEDFGPKDHSEEGSLLKGIFDTFRSDIFDGRF